MIAGVAIVAVLVFRPKPLNTQPMLPVRAPAVADAPDATPPAIAPGMPVHQIQDREDCRHA